MIHIRCGSCFNSWSAFSLPKFCGFCGQRLQGTVTQERNPTVVDGEYKVESISADEGEPE